MECLICGRHVDGPFFDLIQTAFSPNHPLKRARDFTGKVRQLHHPKGIVAHCTSVQNGEPTVRVKMELMRCVLVCCVFNR